MKLFFHIRDHGPAGLHGLGELFLIGNPTILWSPPFQLLERLNREGKFPYSPEEIVELVRHGNVKVATRNGWFDQAVRMSDPSWAAYGWHKCDEDLAGILEEDPKNESARVSYLGAARGSEIADEIIAQANADSQAFIAGSDAVRKVAWAEFVVDNGLVPAGSMIRLQRQFGGALNRSQLVRQIIRDAVNYNDAWAALGYNLDYHEHGRFPLVEYGKIAGLENLGSIPSRFGDNAIDPKRVLDLIEFLRSLNGNLSTRTLIEISTDKQVMREIDYCLKCDLDFRFLLIQQVREGIADLSAFDQAFQGSLLQKTVAVGTQVGGVLLGAIQTSIDPSFSSMLGFALSTLLSVANNGFVPLVERLGLASDSQYSGPVLPALVRYDGKPPTRKEILNLQWDMERLVERELKRTEGIEQPIE